MGHNREDSEEDLDGADGVLLFTGLFVCLFLLCFSKTSQREIQTSTLEEWGLFGELVDEIFCPALNSPWILGLGVLKDACEV